MERGRVITSVRFSLLVRQDHQEGSEGKLPKWGTDNHKKLPAVLTLHHPFQKSFDWGFALNLLI